jgi:carboxylate-amine ligase
MRSSVGENRFGAGPPFTVGIEEEYMLLDPSTLALTQRVESLLAAEQGGSFADRVSCEIFESELEVKTPPCSSIAEAELELLALRGHVSEAGRALEVAIAAAGTHPFGLFEDQLITDRERYHGIVEQIQYPARRELIFGLHVHVGVPDREAAIRAAAAVRLHICDLVALSASSPFWRGRPTGLHSTRHTIFATFPRAGVPPRFAGWAEFEQVVSSLERAGAIPDYTRLWWDVRPHPRLGTVEVRAMDAVPRAEDAVAIAAYVQALVARAVAHGPEPGEWHDAIVHENKWQAVRHGLGATVFDGVRGGPLPLVDRIRGTLDELAPVAEALGSSRQLARIEGIVDSCTSSERQLRVHARTGSVVEVAAAVVAETSGAAALSV